MGERLTLDDVRAARERIRPHLAPTPLRPSLAAAGTVLVRVGGGGLIAGLATAVKALSPDTRIVAVQPEASPALRESLKLGRPLLDTRVITRLLTARS